MTETTKEQLVSAASTLLDEGGQEAVTLRAVAERVGVSHNAPYRHFSGRGALLAAVAGRDFATLTKTFADRDGANGNPEDALRAGAAALIAYALAHKARYRLLFSDPQLPSDASLREAAFGAFTAFNRIVARCQREGVMPGVDTLGLTGLIYAALHGAIDLHLGGRAVGAKGLGSIEATAALLFDILAGGDPGRPAASPDP